ncbi:hypothetical protein ABMA27_015379 [Loxostege sticticalis]|uniref:Uncharacterized protein n=1 Tax=Loxostege sticticalis TaxID=481309 RepID=A0ABR3I7I9_LOXSC
MFFKLVCLCSVAACVIAKPSPTEVVPLEKQQPTVIPIVSQSEELELNGTYKYSYETGNGIKREETSYDKVVPKAQGRSALGSGEGSGSDESDEIHVQQGSYSYTAPDGTVITVKYIADENGFRPVGDHLPKAPAFVQQQIDASNKEKAGRALSVDSAGSPSTVEEKSQAAPSPAEAKPEAAPEEVEPKEKSVVPAVPASQPLNAGSESSTAAAAEATSTGAPEVAASTVAAEQAAVTEAASTTASSEVKTTAASEESPSTQSQAVTSEAVSSEATQSNDNVSTTEAASSTTTSV